jgi:hypothetical protein
LLTRLDLAGEPVELGDDQGVAGAAGGEGLEQAGALAVGAGDAVVDVVPTSAQRRLCRPLRYADLGPESVGRQGDRLEEIGIITVPQGRR